MTCQNERTKDELLKTRLFDCDCVSSQPAVNLVDVSVHGYSDRDSLKHPHSADEYNLRTGQASRSPRI